MQSIDLLHAFLEAAARDARISPLHITTYVAILRQWHSHNFENPLPVNRHLIMPLAKISSRHTYNRCMQKLKRYSYIHYLPSCHSSLQSRVYLLQPLMK